MTFDEGFYADLLEVELKEVVRVDRRSIPEPQEKKEQQFIACDRGAAHPLPEATCFSVLLPFHLFSNHLSGNPINSKSELYREAVK